MTNDRNASKAAPQGQYAQIVATRNAEIAAVWSRYNIQWLINAGLLGIFVANHDGAFVPWAMAAAGEVLALVWVFVTRRGHFWVDFWNRQLADLEPSAGYAPVFQQVRAEVRNTWLTVNRLALTPPFVFVVWWAAVFGWLVQR